MAYNEKGRFIADPYLTTKKQRDDYFLTQRLTEMHRQAYDVRNEARGPRDLAQRIREDMDLPSGDAPHLEGRSNMQQGFERDDDGYAYDTFTDADLMPEGSKDTLYGQGGSSIPVDAGIQAFQESGHGVTVFKPMRRDYKVYKEDEEN
jgi:hypothetical protein